MRAAVTHLRHAAERARSLGAPTEAAAHLRVAVDLVDDDVRLRAEVERDLARSLTAAGRYDEAIRFGESAIAAFDELGDEINAGLAAAPVGKAYCSGRGEVAKALAVTRPRYHALLDLEGADAALLELAAPLTFALERAPMGELRGHMELDELLQQRATLAERSGDLQEQRRAWLGLALRYQEMGSSALCLVLLEAVAASARESRDTLALTMALVNLNAIHNSGDSSQAVELGREAVANARTLGDAFAMESSVLNLLIALWCRGAWDEVDEVIGEDYDGLDRTDPSIDHVRWWAASARGVPYVPLGDVLAPEALANPQLRLWRRATDALVAAGSGDVEEARTAALDGVEGARAFAGFSDDFFITWLDAVHVARMTSQVDLLRELHALALTIPESLLRASMRAGTAYAAALISIEVGAADEVVEGFFAEAETQGETWGATLWGSRFRVDHAAWLVSRGRLGEARGLAAVVREFCVATGSDAWLEEIEAVVRHASHAEATTF